MNIGWARDIRDGRGHRRAIGFAGPLLVLAVVGCGASPSVTNSPSAPATILASPTTPYATESENPTESASVVATATATATLGHGQFALTGSMAVVRNGQTATLLRDGRVLVAGGSGDSTTELYDPHSGTFGPTGSINVVRFGGDTATLLPDGRVLIAGGNDSSLDRKSLASAELYDPASGTFMMTGSMATARAEATASLLPNGRVLVAGGYDDAGTILKTAELYDPGTGRFAPAGAMTHARVGHAAASLEDGRVLIVGGSSGGGVTDTTPASAEVYEPKTGKFSLTGSMSIGRCSDLAATRLTNGLILVEGGSASSVEEVSLASAELFDAATGKFRKTGPMAVARDTQTATLLTNGLVLIAGGDGVTAPAELFDPTTGTFRATGKMNVARNGQTATLLLDGRVLLVGGADAPDGATAELYQP